MVHRHDGGEFKLDLDESVVDRALAAAFGDGGAATDRATIPAPSVVNRIEQRLGVRTQLLLRESGDEDSGGVLLPSGARVGRTGVGGARYQVFGEIARGGMGAVLKGRDVDLGRDVAIKVLQPRFAKQPLMVQRFVEEAQIAGQLQHPGVLPVYELGLQADDRPYFSMKLIKGRTLAELLADRADPHHDRPRMLKIYEQVCQAMAYAHSRGVVHRDLKPANVMVGAFGEVQIVDWGLAKVLGRPDRTDAPAASPEGTQIETVRTSEPGSASLAGAVMGTPGYMSPEQARGEVEKIDERTDVYALGAMMFEILTGTSPSPPEGEQTALPALAAASQPEPDLSTLTRDCLAARMEERPRNAKAIADRVGAYFDSLETRARTAEIEAAEERALAHAARHRRRLTLLFASIITVATIVICLGGAWVYVDRQARNEQAAIKLAGMISNARERLGAAAGAGIDNDAAWDALEDAAAHVEGLLSTVPPRSDVAQQARALLDEVGSRARQRRLAATVEDVVIRGATHYDPESWRRMEQDLRAVLLEFGIDLDHMNGEEVARRIREDEATFELADGLELWLGTLGSLVEMGAVQMPMEEFRGWLDTLLAADPDPVRRRVRELVYGALFMEPVDRAEVEQLVKSLDFDQVHPRTLSWLATVYYALGDAETMVDLYRRISDAHPADFMMMFDAAFSCASLGKHEQAIRYFLRSVSLRPEVPGIWRQLGNAYRNTDELEPSLAALNRSIELDPTHGPTFADRAETRLALAQLEGAIADANAAMELGDSSAAAAWFVIGRARLGQNDRPAALAAFERCRAAAIDNLRFTAPLDEWIERARGGQAADDD